MDRIYDFVLQNHFAKYTQMAFLVGPRQVGKTTIALGMQKHFDQSIYLNWDVVKDREKIISGQDFIENIFPLHVLRDQKPLVIFDEIHKYKDWKNYLKGFYDIYKNYYHILVTGSARLDIYQSGGDSLMGRYFQYTVYPLTLGETINLHEFEDDVFLKPPKSDDHNNLQNLLNFGGFPDPFLQKDNSYCAMWQNTRLKQLVFEDVQTIAQIHDIYLIEVLTEILKEQTGQLINKSSIGKKIKVTTQTVSRWIETLERFFYCFSIKPWHKNVTRSLIKEPKLYLWDWSLIKDEGMRYENMIAVSLMKFCKFFSEQGRANFELFYLRDIDKKEVDFLITKDRTPYMIVEAKFSQINLNKNIYHFQKQLQPLYTLQVVCNLKNINQSCFKDDSFIYCVPASTFLSQLI